MLPGGYRQWSANRPVAQREPCLPLVCSCLAAPCYQLKHLGLSGLGRLADKGLRWLVGWVFVGEVSWPVTSLGQAEPLAR